MVRKMGGCTILRLTTDLPAIDSSCMELVIARPRSQMHASPSTLTKMFFDLMSRCAMLGLLARLAHTVV